MTTLALTENLGKLATLYVGELEFTVQIIDSRTRWGKIDYLVTPDSGKGQTWKSADSLRIS